MPLVSNNSPGSQIVASAKVARQFTVTVAAGATSVLTDEQLEVNMLPNCQWYCIVSAGPAGCSIQPQFAVANAIQGPGLPDIFDYTPVLPPQLLVVGTPYVYGTRLTANAIAALLTVPGGGIGATFRLILAASQ